MAFWAIKKLTFNMEASGEARKLQLLELDEWRLQAYENAKIYKESMKRWHDHSISKKAFEVGQKVLLFNSRLCLFPSKLKSCWSGLFIIKEIYPHRMVELTHEDGANTFTVNGQRIKTDFEGNFDREKISINQGNPE
ncbi:uncharacterized protein LOC120081089 [Benincasa hispida]|uniref:uncharacterized protein LOC120081089 n=1 Tax=Benincasa hispida TaxID=102211 RepID=UPI001901D809|nr:uncharacterized protein LOC120081089 [Benincasa hispida]